MYFFKSVFINKFKKLKKNFIFLCYELKYWVYNIRGSLLEFVGIKEVFYKSFEFVGLFFLNYLYREKLVGILCKIRNYLNLVKV